MAVHLMAPAYDLDPRPEPQNDKVNNKNSHTSNHSQIGCEHQAIEISSVASAGAIFVFG
jgi:hypothetical protein